MRVFVFTKDPIEEYDPNELAEMEKPGKPTMLRVAQAPSLLDTWSEGFVQTRSRLLEREAGPNGGVSMSDKKGSRLAFAAFVDRVQDEISHDVVTAYLYDQKAERFHSPVGLGLWDEATFRDSLPRPDRVAGKIVKQRLSLWTDNAPVDPNFAGAFVHREDIRSSFGVPLIRGDTVIGVFFGGYRRGVRDPEKHLRYLQDVAQRELAPIAADDLPPAPEGPERAPHDSRLDFLVRQGCNLASAPIVVWSASPQDPFFTPRAATGVPSGEWLGRISTSEPSLITAALASGRPTSVTVEEAVLGGLSIEEAKRCGWRTLIAVPLRRLHQQQAVLCVFPFVERRLAEWEMSSAILELGFQIEEVFRDEIRASILQSLGRFDVSPDPRESPSEVMIAVLKHSIGLFRADGGAFYLYDAECGELGRRYVLSCEASRTWNGSGIAEKVLRERAGVLVGDEEGPIVEPHDGDKVNWVAIALTADEERVGVILLEYAVPISFWQSDRALWGLLSTRAALPLRNAAVERQNAARAQVRELLPLLRSDLGPAKLEEVLLAGCRRSYGCEAYWIREDSNTSSAACRSVQGLDGFDQLHAQAVESGEAVVAWLDDTPGSVAEPDSARMSIMVCPIGPKEVRRGVLVVCRLEDEGHFHRSDRDLLTQVAARTNEALNGLLEAERRAAFDGAINSVNHAVSNILKADEVVDGLLQAVTSKLGFHFAAVQIVDRERSTIEAVAGINAPWADEVVQPLHGDDIQAHVCREARSIVVQGVDRDRRLDSIIHAKFHHERLVRVFSPIKWAGKVIGTIEAGFLREQVPVIDDELVAKLEGVIERFACSMWESSLESVLATIALNAMKIVGATSGTIHLAPSPGSGIVHEATAGFIGPEFLHQYPPRKQGLGHDAIAANDVRWIDDPDELAKSHEIGRPERLWALDPEKYPPGSGIKAIACLPLRHDRYHGSLYVHHWRPHKFTLREGELLKQFGREVEQAVTNLRLLEDFRTRSRALTRLVAVGRSLAEARKLPELLPLVVSSARTTLAADVVTISEYDASSRTFKRPLVEGQLYDEKSIDNVFRAGDSRLALVAARRNVFESDARTESLLGTSAGRPAGEMTFVEREGIQSVAGLILEAREQTVGVLYINYRRRHEFTAYERTLMEGVASYAALAILRAREVSRQLAGQAEAIRAIDLKLGRSVAVDRILDHIVDQCREYLDIVEGYVTLQLADRRRERLSIRAFRNVELNSPDPILIVGRGITARAAREKRPVIVTDVASEGHDYIELKANMASELAVPLLRDGELIGVLNVESERPHAFAAPEVAFLTALSQRAVTAIANASMVDRWGRMWKALASVASENDLRTIHRKIAEIGLEITTADEVVLLPRREHHSSIDMKEALQIRSGDARSGPISGALAQQLADLELSSGQAGAIPTRITVKGGEEGGLSLEVVRIPLRAPRDGGVADLGALWLVYEANNDPKEEDVELTLTFAGQAAVALWNAREIEKGRKAERLVGINVLGANLIHRAPGLLGTIPLNVSIIRQAFASGDSAKVEASLKLLEKDAFKVQELLEAAKTMAPAKVGTQQLLSMNDVVREAVRRAKPPPEVKVACTFLLGSRRVHSSKVAILGILDNLLTNAIKAIKSAGRPGRISIVLEGADNGDVFIRVEDDGCGIAADRLGRVFEPFYSTDRARLGIGLFVAQRLAENMNGRIDAASNGSRGATFVVHIPDNASGQNGEINAQAATHR